MFTVKFMKYHAAEQGGWAVVISDLIGNPGPRNILSFWIPAFAGLTNVIIHRELNPK
ncbi:MAG: hypothetical protein MAG581_02255 [Deltaproteobacteria bacterium]|jgi:hypothetical protein|nr:hypothetical protein [Deltaproteobacteria bacterium]